MTQDIVWMTNSQNLTYRFNNGVPNQLTQSISPWMNHSRTGWDALFAQERWTRGRLTMQAAVRFDRARSWFPAQQEGPSRFLPVPIIIPETAQHGPLRTSPPGWGRPTICSAMAPRRSRYTLADILKARAQVWAVCSGPNPTLRMPQTTSTLGTAGVTPTSINATAVWRPLRPAEPERAGPPGDRRRPVWRAVEHELRTEHEHDNFNPGVLNGWGVRPSDWTLDVSIQRQILPRASATLA